ncbi:penicillin-binding protein 1A [Rhodothalassium salexigens DSM 2132]|uniref:Penicillin-binding protein 1A n=1 Tax=Rhodothalassium salexigens DSM 2132 TaxID=1188247 RepID=A0A4R2PQ02_RHOSA|nr:penicillin-binding protein 1A [Rhodothalassium salexigens DSM 2132]
MGRAIAKWVRRLLVVGIVLGVLGALSGAGVVLWAFLTFGPGLPDHTELAQYEPPIITRIHAGDGSLLTEYARERRIFVPVDQIPRKVKRAFMAAEDKNFYGHFGIDPMSIARAMVRNIQNLGQRFHGASTITQQVARNFLLTNDYSYERKIKEAILALRIEKAFSKDRILELYLNEIYLGSRSYGVGAAALTYFDKALEDLTVAEAAYLAALPKGPANYHPIHDHDAAVGRRNWVLAQMRKNGYIDDDTWAAAVAEPLVPDFEEEERVFRADYFEESVRRRIAERYGSDALYEGGLSVRTTLEPRLQAIAERALRDGLVAYDRRHGWRGPITRIRLGRDWAERLDAAAGPLAMPGWRSALVMELRDDGAVVGFADGSFGWVPFETMGWARKWLPDQRFGYPPEDVSEVLAAGDVVPVEALDDRAGEPIDDFFDEAGAALGDTPVYGLRQIPDIQGAIVALDPHTGRVLALVGGFSYQRSQYNRAIQADRQPGSAFKPFVYAAALEEGFTPSSLIRDAPFVKDQGPGQGKWKPRNYSRKFFGPTTLRRGLEKSRNLMTVRLADHIGMDKVIDLAARFGLSSDMQPTLSFALGAGEVKLIDLTAAYGVFVNGGRKIAPVLVDRIQDRYGRTVYKTDSRACPDCDQDQWTGQAPPVLPDDRAEILDPRHAYQMVSMLKGVVDRGSGRRIRSLGFPLAGKTGTSNEAVDTWFVGFAPDLAVGVFVGFDRPRTLGPGEQGATAAAPIFKQFMAEALGDQPAIPFRRPPGIVLVQVDAETGLPAPGQTRGTIMEAFIPGTEPQPGDRGVLDGSGELVRSDIGEGTDGIY